MKQVQLIQTRISTYLLPVIAIWIFFSSCHKYIQDIPAQDTGSADPINSSYSHAEALQKIIQEYTSNGIPSAAIAIYTDNEGWWEGTAGYAKIENRQPLQPKHLHYLQSVSKTYMAVVILQLKEEGRINLDAKITDYLPNPYKGYITDAHKVTVRHLLNHTSGIAEYTDDINYTAYVIQHPNEKMSTQQLMKYVDGKHSEFTPGSKYRYRNTNYELLAVIADAITGDHAKYMNDKIFKPLQLAETFYRNDSRYPVYPNLVNSYFDRFSDGHLENVSIWQRTNVANMVGDDGVIASPRDAVRFLRGLFEGKLLSAASMAEMKNFVKDGNGKDTYGMGLFSNDFGGLLAYGHGGAGIGAGCGLYYIPSKGLYIFLATNVGTLIDGPVVNKVNDMKTEILSVITGN